MPKVKVIGGLRIAEYSPEESYQESARELREFEERYSIDSDAFYCGYLQGTVPPGMSHGEADDWAFFYRVHRDAKRYLDGRETA